MAATLAHANRCPPIAAVAGITMPADERRSPASLSSTTSTRSCNIRIGVFSAPRAGPSCWLTSARDLPQHHHRGDQAEHRSGHLDDVVHARPTLRVDEVGLEALRLTAGDGLRTGPVDELVDGLGKTFAGRLDLALEGVRRCRVAPAWAVGHRLGHGRLLVWRSCGACPSVG